MYCFYANKAKVFCVIIPKGDVCEKFSGDCYSYFMRGMQF